MQIKKKPLYLFLLLDLIVRDLLKILQKILIKKKKTEKDHPPPFQTTRQSFECGTASIFTPKQNSLFVRQWCRRLMTVAVGALSSSPMTVAVEAFGSSAKFLSERECVSG